MRIFHRLYTRLGCSQRPPRFVVEFHSYANLTHTIRLHEDLAHVRLSDILRDAPLAVLEATAAILLGRLYRRRPPRSMLDTYRRFLVLPSTRRRLHILRQRRGRRRLGDPRGSEHNLESLFARLNHRYFRNRLPRARLGWSSCVWKKQLGSFDPFLRQIVLNRSLDRKEVPEFVVAYVLYHEMLHLKHPARLSLCRMESHPRHFREEEKRFAEYENARKFLTRLR